MKTFFDYFDIEYGSKKYESKGFLINRDGKTPLISSSAKNYGVFGKYDITPDYHRVISVARTGSVGYAFFHNYECSIDNNCLVLTPKVSLTDKQMIYCAAALTTNRFRFMYGRQATPSRVGSLTIPDFPKWLDVYNIEGYTSSPQPYSSTIVSPLNIRDWKDFRYDSLFDIKKGKRLTKQNMTEGRTPFIGSSDANNGLTARIGQPPIHKAHTISVCYNGSVAEAFYQPEDYWATDDVNVLYPKFTLNKYIALFLTSLIRKEKYRYNYGRKWHLGRMNESVIKLPVDESGQPDWSFMERYIKSLPFSGGI